MPIGWLKLIASVEMPLVLHVLFKGKFFTEFFSEEEARMKIYSVSTRCYYAFGALVSEELSYKIKGLSSFK